jgi:arylsulfatase A-like enzyme
MNNKPNLIFFLLDDLGIKDLGCYGSTFHETPRIDQLASEGVRYTNAYASHPVCGPSRSAIMTGKLPAYLGLRDIGGGIPDEEIIWPKVMKEAGYTTYFSGKWHMGGADSVLENGFDYNVGGHDAGQPSDYYYPYKGPYPQQDVPDMEDGKEGDYLTDKLTDKAIDFIDSQGKEPFLLYFSYYQVHKPSISNAQGKREYVSYFKKKLKELPAVNSSFVEKSYANTTVSTMMTQRNPEFAGQIKAVDESVGRILDKLKNAGIADDTIIIFTSDQGCMATSELAVSSTEPYRFGKAFLFDGGLRVPLIIKWPKNGDKGVINDTVTLNTDLYPTIMDMIGLEKNEYQHQHGISIADTLKGMHLPFDRTLYWTYPMAHSLGHQPSMAIRQNEYKLIFWPDLNYKSLYNVVKDINEEDDLILKEPDIAGELFEKLVAWDKSTKK